MRYVFSFVALASIAGLTFIWYASTSHRDVGPMATPVKSALAKPKPDVPQMTADEKASEFATPAVPSETIISEKDSFPQFNAACLAKLANEKLYDTTGQSAYVLLAPGKNGWIFRTHPDYTDDFTFGKKDVTYLQRITKAFADKGVQLVIAYPPTRGLVAADYLPDSTKNVFDPVSAFASYQQSLHAAKRAGIHLVGVPDFDKGEGFFRKTDQHWNVKGARQMAFNVAEEVKAMAVYSELPKMQFKTYTHGTYGFEGRFSEPVGIFCHVKLADEIDQKAETRRLDASEQDLLSDNGTPQVVLVGTSNSKSDTFDADFDGSLKEFLGTDILNMALPGAGYENPMLVYLASDAFRQTPPKVLIWEIPGYYVLKGDDDELSQVLAGIRGDCGDNAVARFTPTSLKKGRNILVSGLKSRGFDSSNTLTMHFPESISKKFSVHFMYENGEEEFKFKPSSHADNHGFFAINLPLDQETPVDGIMVEVNDKKMVGMTLNSAVCASREMEQTL